MIRKSARAGKLTLLKPGPGHPPRLFVRLTLQIIPLRLQSTGIWSWNRNNFRSVAFQSKPTWQLGTAVAQRLRCCDTNRKVAGLIPAGVIGIFHWHKILPIALRLWCRLSSNRNEYQEHFLGMKRPVRKADNLVMKSGKLQSLRRCAINRQVAGSIQAGVIGIFHWHKILRIALWS